MSEVDDAIASARASWSRISDDRGAVGAARLPTRGRTRRTQTIGKRLTRIAIADVDVEIAFLVHTDIHVGKIDVRSVDVDLEAVIADPHPGAVRVEDAERLARWLFGAMPAAEPRDRQQRVDMSDPVPVYITYLTVEPDAQGGIRFRPDRYGRDATALARMFGLERPAMAHRD